MLPTSALAQPAKGSYQGGPSGTVTANALIVERRASPPVVHRRYESKINDPHISGTSHSLLIGMTVLRVWSTLFLLKGKN